MTGTRGGNDTRKRVRRTLADGSVRVYSYPRSRYDDLAVSDPPGLRHLTTAWKQSPEWRRLADNTRRIYDHYLGLVEEELHWMRRSDLDQRRAREEFYKVRDKLAAGWINEDTGRRIGGDHSADMAMRALSTLLSWAVDRNIIALNMAARMRTLGELNTRSDIVVEPAQQPVLLDACAADLADVVQAADFTMLRVSDLVRLQWSMYGKDGWLTVAPKKTQRLGIVVSLPVHALPPFKALLDRRKRDSDFIFTHADGRPWTEAAVGDAFRRARARVELDHLHLHDFRGTRITRLLEIGCTEAEVNACAGKMLVGKKLAGYAARTRQLSLNAYTRWAASLEPAKVVSVTEKKTRKTPS